MLRAGGVIIAMWRSSPLQAGEAERYFVKIKFIRDGEKGDKRNRFVGP